MVYTHKLVVATDGRFAPITESKAYTPENSVHFEMSGGVAVPRSYEPSYVAGNPAAFGVLVRDDDSGLMRGRMAAMSSVERLQVGFTPTSCSWRLRTRPSEPWTGRTTRLTPSTVDAANGREAGLRSTMWPM